MTTSAPYLSGYEKRIDLVRSVLQQHTSLDSSAATDLAVQVLSVINHIAEPVR